MTATLLRQWTVEDYRRMMEAGILTADDRVELLDGQIIQMSPHYSPHVAVTTRAASFLIQLFEGTAHIRNHCPITLPPNSEPQPDIVVARSDPRDYFDRHPQVQDIYLLLEVSDSSLRFDKTQKACVYAQAGIPEYWILDIPDRQVWVLRDPVESGYQTVSSWGLEQEISPIAFSQIRIPVARLFPVVD